MKIEEVKPGTVFSYERTFTVEDVVQFSDISGDKGDHHMIPDEQGRQVVHGFLTATLPTKIGGDFNVMARNFTLQFVRPVFTGDTIRCEVTMHQIEKQESRYQVFSTYVCTNQFGKEVLKGEILGFVRI